jgi:hypothetical protein
VARVYRGLPPVDRRRATIVTGNYGEAAAIDLFASGVPPAASGHNSYWLWRPRDATLEVVVAVGLPEALLHRMFADVRPGAVITNVDGVENEELGKFIRVARGPRADPEEIWLALRHFE